MTFFQSFIHFTAVFLYDLDIILLRWICQGRTMCARLFSKNTYWGSSFAGQMSLMSREWPETSLVPTGPEMDVGQANALTLDKGPRWSCGRIANWQPHYALVHGLTVCVIILQLLFSELDVEFCGGHSSSSCFYYFEASRYLGPTLQSLPLKV